MTKFVAIFPKQMPADYTGVDWRPWVNCDPEDELFPQIVAHAHLRDRGGVTPDEHPYVFYVCIRDTLDVPCEVKWHRFSTSPDKVYAGSAPVQGFPVPVAVRT